MKSKLTMNNSLELKELKSTEDPSVFVTGLPKFSRANKFIGNYYVYVAHNKIPDGTLVIIKAYSEKTGWGQMKNNTSVLRNGVAFFEDMRFVGKSGRNTYYDIYYYFGGCDYFVTYKSAIKVTVDGPRPKRLTKVKKSNSFESRSKLKYSEALNIESECETNNETATSASWSPNSSTTSFRGYSSRRSSSEISDLLKSEPHSPYANQSDIGTMQADNQTSLRIDIGRFNETYFKFRGLPEAQIVPLFQQNPVFFLLYPMLKNVFFNKHQLQ